MLAHAFTGGTVGTGSRSSSLLQPSSLEAFEPMLRRSMSMMEDRPPSGLRPTHRDSREDLLLRDRKLATEAWSSCQGRSSSGELSSHCGERFTPRAMHAGETWWSMGPLEGVGRQSPLGEIDASGPPRQVSPESRQVTMCYLPKRRPRRRPAPCGMPMACAISTVAGIEGRRSFWTATRPHD